MTQLGTRQRRLGISRGFGRIQLALMRYQLGYKSNPYG